MKPYPILTTILTLALATTAYSRPAFCGGDETKAGEKKEETSPSWTKRALKSIKGFVYTTVPTQITLRDDTGLIHVDSPEFSRVNPIALFIINPALRTHAAKDSGFTASYNTSNLWSPTVYVMPKSKLLYAENGDEYFDPKHPHASSEDISEVVFVNPDNTTPVDDLNQQSDIHFSNMSATDFEKYARVMHADGVFREYDLKYTRALPKNSELSGQLKISQLVGGSGPLDPTDRFIEGFHKNILGVDQPYGRNKYPYNQAEIYFRDANGHEVRFNEGDVSAAFRLDYVKSFDFISRDKKSLTSINLIGTAGTALTEKARILNPSIQIGGGINAATTTRFTARTTGTLALGYSAVLPQAIPLGEGVDLGLNPFRGQVAFLAGLSRMNKKNTRVVTYGVGYQKDTITIRKENIAKAPVLENDEKLPIRQAGSNQSANLFNTHNANFQGFVAIEFKRSRITTKFWSGEDLVPSTNGPDINFGASINKKF